VAVETAEYCWCVSLGPRKNSSESAGHETGCVQNCWMRKLVHDWSIRLNSPKRK